MKKVYAILNTLVIFGVIFWNYYSNTGAINNTTVGELSDQYANLFTPAGYAFAIWGLIFLGLIFFGAHQLRLAFFGGDHSETILEVGPWLLIANFGNAVWLWFWLNERTGVTVLVMLVILVALLKVIIRLQMQLDRVSWLQRAFVWWPIALYSGWITVALIANVAAYLVKLQWSAVFTEVQWTLIMISVAAIVNLLVLYRRKIGLFAGVGVWALIAIAIRHKAGEPLLFYTAIGWALLLMIAIAVHSMLLVRTKNVIKNAS